MDERFKVLSLDGGGIRGYLSIKILANMEKELNRDNKGYIPIGAKFDLIAGTSTGAIIAGLLAKGEKATDVCEMYKKDISLIFGKKMRRMFPFNIFPFSLMLSKYKSTELENKAKEYFGNITFENLQSDLLITSVDITNMSLRLHKSDYLIRNHGRKSELVSNAILASTAAPAYFKVARDLNYSDYLIDGGVVANNPSLIAIIDALQFERNSKRDIEKPSSISDITLLSIGTGEIGTLPYDLKPLEDSSFDWLIQPQISLMPPKVGTATPLIDILMETQAKLTEQQVKFLFRTHENENGYLRINPLLKTEVKLDDASKIPILNNLADLNQSHIDWIEKNLKGQK